MSTTTTTNPGTNTTKEVENIPSGDVEAVLNFYGPPLDGSRPYCYVDPPNGQQELQENFLSIPKTVVIHDARPIATSLSLDKQAFEVHTALTALSHSDFDNPAIIESTYYDEVTALIRKHLGQGVEDVVIFDHTLRRNKPDAPRGPVDRVHIDQTPYAGILRVRRHLSEARAREVEENGLRARIINVWRPINGTVVDHPLAFADSSTVNEEDIVGVRHIYKDKEGETGRVHYNEGQKWWYLSGHKTDEVTFIKCWDSDTTVGGGEEGKRGRVPHTAFEHPQTRKGDRLRESIEIRCLVVG
ncbi:putative 7alpha-cephem-methoxylase P8 chain related protein [Geopyxis carbonaria]|nr:putative 7alpha-cephem-methoxylase P8 chain related protein [Geopyxis carbonaria]